MRPRHFEPKRTWVRAHPRDRRLAMNRARLHGKMRHCGWWSVGGDGLWWLPAHDEGCSERAIRTLAAGHECVEEGTVSAEIARL
jgi:hypothetical protein